MVSFRFDPPPAVSVILLASGAAGFLSGGGRGKFNYFLSRVAFTGRLPTVTTPTEQKAQAGKWREWWAGMFSALVVTASGSILTALPHHYRSAIEAAVPPQARVTALCWSLSAVALLLTLNVLQWLRIRQRLRLKRHAHGYVVDGRGVPLCPRCERALIAHVNLYTSNCQEWTCPDCKGHYPYSG